VRHSRMKRRSAGSVRRWLARLRSRRGSITVMTALSMPVVLGFAGLATEASLWYASKRTAQGAADSAAYSAAVISGGNLTQYRKQAQAVAAQYGLLDGTAGVTVTVNSPPTSGVYNGTTGAVEVIIQQPQTQSLSQLFLSAAPTVYARAVAKIGNAGLGCVVSLDTAYLTGVGNNGNTTVGLQGCDIYDNATGPSSFTLSGVSSLSANSAHFGGGDQLGSNTTLTTTNGVFTNQQPIADPYAFLPNPTVSGSNLGAISGSGSFSPGRYSGINLNSGNIANLSPGTYYIDSGGIDLHGGATLNGTGVTIILTSSSSTYGNVTIRGGSTLNLTAPTSGTFAGVALYQDRNAPASNPTSNTAANSFNGGTAQNITGAIYFPNQSVSFGGGTASGGAQCTQLIAQTVTFSGNSVFKNNCKNNCTGTGTQAIGQSTPTLVE
jgi:Flp pilus assembly protein TadG